MTSRFHIVKIDTGPQKRGRWTCQDREEPTNMTSSSTLPSQQVDAGGGAAGLLTSSSVVGGGGSSGTNSSRSSSHGAAAQNADDAALSPLSEIGESSPPPLGAPAGGIVDDAHDGSIWSGGGGFTTACDSPLPPSSKFVVTGVPGSARKVPAANVVLTSAADLRGTPPPPSGGAGPTNAFAAISFGASPSSAFVRVQPQRATQAPINDQSSPKAQQFPQQGLVTQAVVNVVDGGTAATAAAVVAQAVANQLAAAAVGNEIAAGAATTTALLGSILPPPIGSPQAAAVAVSADKQIAEPTASLDGSLAIDNKIEQAMDLVKTHLRYAVREEVEVLKQRIQELEKYVDNLEKENKLLREYAPQEILAQLRLSEPQQQPVVAPAGTAPAGSSTYAALPAAQPMGQTAQPAVQPTGQPQPNQPAAAQTLIQAAQQPMGQMTHGPPQPQADPPTASATPSTSHSPPHKHPVEQPVAVPTQNGPVLVGQMNHQSGSAANPPPTTNQRNQPLHSSPVLDASFNRSS